MKWSFVTAGAIALAACTATVNTDGLSSDEAVRDSGAAADAMDATLAIDHDGSTEDDASDPANAADANGSTGDAGVPPTDAAPSSEDAAPPMPSDLVANGGFEMQNGVGCGPDWNGREVNPSPRAHSGAYACLVCNGTIAMTTHTPIDGGPQVVVRGYARIVASDGSDAAALAPAINCLTLPDGGAPACATMSVGTSGGHVDYGSSPIGTDWSAFGDTQAAGRTIYVDISVGFSGVPAGDCVLLDDVTLTYGD